MSYEVRLGTSGEWELVELRPQVVGRFAEEALARRVAGLLGGQPGLGPDLSLNPLLTTVRMPIVTAEARVAGEPDTLVVTGLAQMVASAEGACAAEAAGDAPPQPPAPSPQPPAPSPQPPAPSPQPPGAAWRPGAGR